VTIPLEYLEALIKKTEDWSKESEASPVKQKKTKKNRLNKDRLLLAMKKMCRQRKKHTERYFKKPQLIFNITNFLPQFFHHSWKGGKTNPSTD